MKSTGISVIIPCYNVEKFIEKCLDSIIIQNLNKYEIILIDDCSKDNTVEVIKKYQKEHFDIDINLLVNEKNSGAGYSRNSALKIAKYDVISFIDSDDYVEKNFYNELLNEMLKNNADISVCDIYVKSDEISYRSAALDGANRKLNFINNGLAASPCNKLFKKELLLKFPFAEGIMNEDIPTVISCLTYAKKIAYTKNTYYNYIQHKSSVQNSSISDKRFDIFKAIDLLNTRISSSKSYSKIWEAVIYQQIIMFFIYVIPKEKNFWKRAKVLKKFYYLSRDIHIRQNHLLWHFVDLQGKKHKYYYKLLLKLNDNGFSYLSSLLISVYDFLKSIKNSQSVIKKDLKMADLVIEAKKQSKKKCAASVSVVIPNYNYEKFLIQRIYSILYQTYAVKELIILDDCSTDNSVALINEISDNINEYVPVKTVINKKNSKCVFKQWEKGFNASSGDYVWIAEADDYCEKNFLEANMRQVQTDKEIILSYCDTAFIDKDGHITYKSIVPEIDIQNKKHWDKSYIIDGSEEIKKYSYLNCTIANVSSVIMKNGNYEEVFKMAQQYKQVGDWRFYLGMYELGKVSYVNKTLNYYRVHGNNVTSTTKKQAHFNEIKQVHEELNNIIKFNTIQRRNIKKRYKFLARVWNIRQK